MAGRPICSAGLASLPPVDSKPAESSDRPATNGRPVTFGAYATLFVCGLLEGLIGCFHYGQGPAPLAAIGFALAIALTCVLGAWGMTATAGALAPAAGWFVAAVVLSTGTQGGSVIITDTTAGKWFLFGGGLSVIAACIFSATRWSRSRAGRRAPGTRRPRARL